VALNLLIIYISLKIFTFHHGSLENALDHLALERATQLNGISGKLNIVEMQVPFGTIFIEGVFNKATIQDILKRNSFYLSDKADPELKRISEGLKNHQIARLEGFLESEALDVYIVTWTSSWECRMKVLVVSENRILLISTGNPTENFSLPSAQCNEVPPL